MKLFLLILLANTYILCLSEWAPVADQSKMIMETRISAGSSINLPTNLYEKKNN